jgi:uncharacterized protein YndB with AHSA1/START domain
MNEDPRDIVTERVMDAPPDKIFRAFEEPERLARWWGPKDFRNTFERFEFRPGGEWKFVMHGPDGKDYANYSVLREIEKPSRIVLEHQSAPHFLMTITLNAEAGKTRVRWCGRFDTPRIRDQIASYAVPANEQNLDRLEAELGTMAN